MFQGLLRLHILATIHYVNAVYDHSSENKTIALKRLTLNIQQWANVISSLTHNSSNGKIWHRLFLEHTLAAGELAEGVLHCCCHPVRNRRKKIGKCASGKAAANALQKLVANQRKIVAFLGELLGKQRLWNYHWSKHLECTKRYIDTLNIHGRGLGYLHAKRHCLHLGRAFGIDLDTATTK